ncbi:MAG: prepilin-type N-terminal cleavage/methylation domain-containing protein [Nitrospirota bacterium]
MRNQKGITLVELIIVIAIIGILALIGIPEINRFSSDYRVRSCATDLIQNMRVARAMAMKENREYLIVFDTTNQRYMIGFDGNGDKNLVTLNSDTFGICKDTDGDRLPNNDTDANGDGVPDCVRVVNLSSCGNNIIFGYGTGTTPPNGPPYPPPPGTTIPASGVNFGGTPPTAEFDSDGSMDKLGSVYFQQTSRGYSYCTRVSNNAGALNIWKWNGDKDNPTETNWSEYR